MRVRFSAAFAEKRTRPPEWLASSPPLAEVLDDFVRLLVADFDQFFAEVASLPFDNDRAEFPAEVPSQRFVCRAIVMLESPS
jgi:hypothetical protein